MFGFKKKKSSLILTIWLVVVTLSNLVKIRTQTINGNYFLYWHNFALSMYILQFYNDHTIFFPCNFCKIKSWIPINNNLNLSTNSFQSPFCGHDLRVFKYAYNVHPYIQWSLSNCFASSNGNVTFSQGTRLYPLIMFPYHFQVYK
jgi:hypothetical protein